MTAPISLAQQIEACELVPELLSLYGATSTATPDPRSLGINPKLRAAAQTLRALAAPPSEQAAMTSAGDYTTDPIYDGKTLAELAIAPPSDEEVTDAREQYDALLNVLAEHRSTLERLSTAVAALAWKFDAPAIGRNTPLWTELNDAQAQAIALLKGGGAIVAESGKNDSVENNAVTGERVSDTTRGKS